MRDLFPGLDVEGFRVTSPPDVSYNCIAWAAGRTGEWWWPDELQESIWPSGVERVESKDAFLAAFATLGYLACSDGALEPGTEKIAIFMQDGKPTHAARQLASGGWTSKLGKIEDIVHALSGLEGAEYGTVVAYMKRPRIGNA